MRHVPAFLACAAFAAVWAWAFSPPPAPTYELAVYYADGSIHVRDHGLTWDDCERAAHAYPDAGVDAIFCDPEA